jgi:phosphoglycerol transferase MdoB-like AlkP superfamily enzyme
LPSDKTELKSFLKNSKQKNPATFGFFSFLLLLTAWTMALQWAGRTAFLFLRGAHRQLSALEVIQSYMAGFPLDIAFSGYFLLLAIIIFWLGKSWRQQPLRFLLLLIGSLFIQTTIIIHLADAEMYAAWGSKFNRQALQYLTSPKEAMASTSEANWVGIVTIWLAVSAVFQYFLSKLVLHIVKDRQPLKLQLLTAGRSLVSLAALGIIIRGGFGNIPINQSVAMHSSKTAANMAAVNSGWNFLYYVINKNEKINPEQYHFYKKGNDEKILDYFLNDNFSTKPLSHLTQPNVCIIILESFSAYASKYLTGTNHAMPYLDQLQGEGLSFKRAYASGDRTDKGLAAVLGGWHGQPWQSILHEPDKAAKLPSLAQLFNQKGYQTGFLYGGDLGFANMKSYLYAAGFGQIQDQANFERSQLTSKWGAHDEWAFKKLLTMNKEARQPFFHVLLTLSSHEPYDVPGGPYYQSQSPQSELLNSIAYTDRCIQQFMKEAAAEPWFKNTLFVMVADHGRDLGFPETQFDRSGHFHIPLFFWGNALHPDLKGEISAHVVSQTAIAETLSQGLGLSSKKEFPNSGSLLSAGRKPTAMYIFNSGFGVVHDSAEVVFHNQPGHITHSQGKPKFTDSLLQFGQIFQYQQILKYLKQ